VDAGCTQRLAAVMDQVDKQLQAADGGDEDETEE
jgi:flagellar assembly protein FliH